MNKFFIILLINIFCIADDYNATQQAEDLNLAIHTYNGLMGFCGLLCGFVLLFSLIIIASRRY